MASKEAGLPFNIFNSVAVSGSASPATFTSSVTTIRYRDNIGYQINFTGTPQGVLQINACNDYNPNWPQSGPAQGAGNGTWITLTSVSIQNVVSPIGFNLNQVPFGYIQCQYLNSTASGTISGWVATKSLG